MSHCNTHLQCSQKGTYCTDKEVCEAITECPVMRDSITGSCPLHVCNAESSCESAAYCEGEACYCGDGMCYPKKVGDINVCENNALRTSLNMPECE